MAEDFPGAGTPRPPSRVPGTHMEHGHTPADDSEESTRVSGILSQVTDVNSLPVHERVAVYERVHEQLRRSLDGPSGAENAGRE